MTENLPAEQPSPVERLDPKLIQELFDMDPLKLSDQDIDKIIAHLRADRAAFMMPAPAKPKKASASKSAVVPLGEISLLDLGLE